MKKRYFTIKDGEIYSCATDAKNDEQAMEAVDEADADSVIFITEKTAQFIARQFTL